MKNAYKILSLFFALCFIFGCQEKVAELITADEAKAITYQVLPIWNEGDLAVADELYASGYIRHHPTPSDSAGLDDFKATVVSNRSLFPDYKLTFDEMIIEGDRLIILATMTGTNTAPISETPATGKRVRMNGVYIFRISDGKIAEEWTFFNLLSYYQQLGYRLSPPSSPQ